MTDEITYHHVKYTTKLNIIRDKRRLKEVDSCVFVYVILCSYHKRDRNVKCVNLRRNENSIF